MLNLQNITVQFSGTPLYEDISLTIRDRDRVALAGKNGAGKSTLLKIIVGKERPDSGQIVSPQGYSIGYLPQDISAMKGKTVYEETASAFDEIRGLEREVERITKELGEREDYDSKAYANLVDGLSSAQSRLDYLGAANAEKEVEMVLGGLGFQREDFERPIEEFSGGWQMRVELAKILLKRPDLVLLDEPTNHLDIDSVQWLESFLLDYPGALMLVSHDRAFLDTVTTRTVEISMRKLHDYKASWSKYLEMRAERREQQMNAKKNQDKHIQHTEELINKFRAKKNKAKFAQSLIKKLDKVERIEMDQEDLAKIRFRFPPAPRSGKVVVSARDMDKSYGDLNVLRKVNFEIMRGEKVAFVGRNGEGKSTLSKMIVGTQQTTSGELEIGYNVSISYYAQDQTDSLDGNDTVFDTIDNAAAGEMRSNVRSLLGAFLFSGEDVDKKVKVLSGGEKSRLAMAKLLLEPANLLVLDEPTNHLDMVSKGVLKKALQQFDGTIIVVSHDRDFLKGLTNNIYEFAGGSIKEYKGDIYDYLEEKQMQTMRELETTLAGGARNRKDNLKPKESKPGLSHKDWFEAKKDAEKEEKRLKRSVDRNEREIEELEIAITEMEVKLQDSEFYKQADQPFFDDYNSKKEKLQEVMAKWEEEAALLDKATARKQELQRSKPPKD